MSVDLEHIRAAPPSGLAGFDTLGKGLRTERCFLAALFLALVAIYCAFAYDTYADARGLHDGLGVLIGRDFVVFWTASVLTLKGQLANLFDLGQFTSLQRDLMGVDVDGYPWLYPPQALLYVLPLGLLPYLWSYALWCVATFVLYLAAVQGRCWTTVQTCALLLAPASVVCLFMGQNGLLSAALLIGGLRLLDRRPVIAGVLLGLLCFKPQLALLVPVALVAARLWRPFLSAAVTTAFVLALSVAVFGVESWVSFLEVTRGYQAQLLGAADGPFLDIVVSPYMSARLLGLDLPARYLVQALFTLGAVAGVYVAYRSEAGRPLQAVVLLAAVLLASPYGYHYDLPLVAAAAAWAYKHAREAGFLPGERTVLALVWLLPLLVVYLNPMGLPIAPFVLAAFFALVLGRACGWVRRPSMPASAQVPGSGPGLGRGGLETKCLGDNRQTPWRAVQRLPNQCSFSGVKRTFPI
jgi:hypothetical protein